MKVRDDDIRSDAIGTVIRTIGSGQQDSADGVLIEDKRIPMLNQQTGGEQNHQVETGDDTEKGVHAPHVKRAVRLR